MKLFVRIESLNIGGKTYNVSTDFVFDNLDVNIMHIITEVLLFINLVDGPTFSVKLIKTIKPMVITLHFCICCDFQLLLYLSSTL